MTQTRVGNRIQYLGLMSWSRIRVLPFINVFPPHHRHCGHLHLISPGQDGVIESAVASSDEDEEVEEGAVTGINIPVRALFLLH